MAKRFASPARRMKPGLQFLKTINSRKFITNAKTVHPGRSIYNGRVTRVLPGMQSAFVDLGLERDAFLYVTDFMELEDSEESDELEKAAASGANQPPREVATPTAAAPPSNNARNASRTEFCQRPEAGPAQRGDRSQRDRRPAGELVIESTESTAATPWPRRIFSRRRCKRLRSPAGSRRWRGRAIAAVRAGSPARPRAVRIPPLPLSKSLPNPANRKSPLRFRPRPASLKSARPAPLLALLAPRLLSRFPSCSPANRSASTVAPRPTKLPARLSLPLQCAQRLRQALHAHRHTIEWDGSGLLPASPSPAIATASPNLQRSSNSRHRIRPHAGLRRARIRSSGQGLRASCRRSRVRRGNPGIRARKARVEAEFEANTGSRVPWPTSMKQQLKPQRLNTRHSPQPRTSKPSASNQSLGPNPMLGLAQH